MSTIWGAEVEFKGNHSRQYDYFIEVPTDDNGPLTGIMPHLQDLVICQTGTGYGLGRIVKLKELDKVSSLCSKWCVVWHDEHILNSGVERCEKILRDIRKQNEEVDPLAGLL